MQAPRAESAVVAAKKAASYERANHSQPAEIDTGRYPSPLILLFGPPSLAIYLG